MIIDSSNNVAGDAVDVADDKLAERWWGEPLMICRNKFVY